MSWQSGSWIIAKNRKCSILISKDKVVVWHYHVSLWHALWSQSATYGVGKLVAMFILVKLAHEMVNSGMNLVSNKVVCIKFPSGTLKVSKIRKCLICHLFLKIR